MSIIEGFKMRLARVHRGDDTWLEFMLQYVDRTAKKCLGKTTTFYLHTRISRFFGQLLAAKVPVSKKGNIYYIRNIKLPNLNLAEENLLWCGVYYDTFKVYAEFNDNYSEEIFDTCYKNKGEGAYGLVNDKVNVTVNPGDIVIDAGSWIGDFAAYASVKGAVTYAFEPTDSTFAILEQTAELNGNIFPIKKGLSDENTSMQFFVSSVNSEANRFSRVSNTQGYSEASSRVQTTTIDDFVRENNLPRVDFIKADIEGFERHMLAGAQDTLARFAPKLALCTYHLPDDPEVMTRLILQANPKYNIVQKRKKLFASVPE